MINKCECKHEYQDKLYGKGFRWFNAMYSGGKQTNKARCIVCGRITEVAIKKDLTKKEKEK